MSELRQDRTTGGWVIIAPERRRRPQWRSEAAPGRQRVPSFDPECAFCPGNEAELPGIIEETSTEGIPGWRVRVVPNKYPALRPEPAGIRPLPGGHEAVPSYGFHEVIIESPRHDADLATMSDVEIEAVVAAYCRRFVSLAERQRIQHVILFRNYGPSRGASIAHPHAQLVAIAMTPAGLQARADWARAWYRDHGRCVVCDELEVEQKNGRRVVEATDYFIALVPFAATCPFELWLVPKRHQASFSEIDRGELTDLGVLLRGALQRLQTALDDPPYNFVIDSAGTADAGRPDLHWRLRIAPGLVTPGGFEIATGMSINPSSPEDDALALRSAGGAG